MVFSLKYKPVRLKSGNVFYRPMIPLVLKGRKRIDVLAVLDSGSDMTVIPKEIAEFLELEYSGDNEVSGISGTPIRAKEGRVNVIFGRGREIYGFEIPVLIPIDKKDVPIIIGRVGFFNQFKITFSEAERRIDFKKFNDFLQN